MKNIFYRVTTIAYMAVLMLISIRPVLRGHGCDMPRQVFNNILHIPAYALLAYLVIKSLPKFKYIYIASFLFAVAFGVFNEYLQSFVPDRYPSIMDVLLNGIGSLSVVIARRQKADEAISTPPSLREGNGLSIQPTKQSQKG